MKKMTFLACAAMLTSALVFTGCKNETKNPANVPTVTADVAISLPGQVGNNGMRHMPGATVQTGGVSDFTTNGMKNMYLVPFGPKEKVSSSSVRLGDNIELGTIGTTQAYTVNTAGRAKVFTGKQVPTGTSAFLFYGESGASGTLSQTGYLGYAFANSEQPASFLFSLKPINSDVTTITNNAAYEDLIAYLNHVANATDGTKVWKNYTASDNDGLYQMFQTFATATSLSSFGVRRMMHDMYKSLKSNTSDAMAQAIKDSITDGVYASLDANDSLILNTALQGFPETLGLPQGAVAVAYSAGAFDGNAAHAYGTLAPANVELYAYAPSLWYTSNTLIKTAKTSKQSEYTGKSSWQAILDTYDSGNGSVNSTTRSIALQDTVQYAVARLDVMLRYKDDRDYLADNNPIPADTMITKPATATGFPVTAVLVGGQKDVGFDFKPKGSTIYTLYDNVMTDNTMKVYHATNYSATNSTLVLESPADTDEFIAVELTNTTGKDFYGVDGIVPAGAKFYLVAKLEASLATETEDAEHHKYVFKQDYTTTARLAIKNLKSAYIVIPDLRAPQLEIGLSVDLTWQSGHTYDIDL